MKVEENGNYFLSIKLGLLKRVRKIASYSLFAKSFIAYLHLVAYALIWRLDFTCIWGARKRRAKLYIKCANKLNAFGGWTKNQTTFRPSVEENDHWFILFVSLDGIRVLQICLYVETVFPNTAVRCWRNRALQTFPGNILHFRKPCFCGVGCFGCWF